MPPQNPPINSSARLAISSLEQNYSGETTGVKRTEQLAALREAVGTTLTMVALLGSDFNERSEWGNNASPVTKEQVAALRKELASHPSSFNESEILGTADQDLPGGEGGAPPGAPPKPGEAQKPAPPK